MEEAGETYSALDKMNVLAALDQLDALAAYVREMASVFIADRRAVVEECKKVMFDYFSKNALYTDAIDALDRILEKKP
jgi:hypothetical protein